MQAPTGGRPVALEGVVGNCGGFLRAARSQGVGRTGRGPPHDTNRLGSTKRTPKFEDRSTARLLCIRGTRSSFDRGRAAPAAMRLET
eukprot:scaffold8005_cov67-Phaeocystis_antarctica.AAC.1